MSGGVVIAAGGTAGHVYPGLALADAIRRHHPEAAITFVGTPRGIERDAVTKAGYAIHMIDVVPWARTLGARRFLAPASLAGASAKARGLLRRVGPRAVVGMGGYASLPVVLAAWSRRIPTVLHEQNAIPGIANSVGARFARRIALTFEEARTRFPRDAEIRVVGNPLRAAIKTLDRAAARDDAARAFDLDPSRRTILVMGGSLGAARLNDAVVGLAERWRARGDMQLLVSAGRGHGEIVRGRVESALRDAELRVRILDYLERVELAYAAADLAICRAGAATVAELAAVGLPSILVPYPYARANHQEHNARALERAGGATVVLDRAADAAALGGRVEELIGRDAALRRMADAARAFGKPDAADDLAGWVLTLAGGER